MSDKKKLKNIFRKEVRPHRLFLRRRQSKSSLQLQLSGSSDVAPHLLVGSAASGTSDDKKRKGYQPLRRFLQILRPNDLSDNVHSPALPVLACPPTSHLSRDYNIGHEIGAGASGSVNLVTAKSDGRLFALKRFRHQLKGEPLSEYLAKVRNEFVIGEHLHHPNLIRTVRMFQEEGARDYYILMEYCPYDFFNLVMSGLMSRGEIFCYLRQIVNGVAHLHAAGIAHRDLKLDNCVVDVRGVLKLVDFGLAFQFRKARSGVLPPNSEPHGDDHVLVYARGIVGSDPYLSPEVLVNKAGYDPRLADIWSVAIIYCCMVLKRFPWKLPRTADPLYRAFAGLNNLDQPVSAEEMLATTVSELTVHEHRVPKYGPDRLLALLPTASRPLMRGMLTIDPAKRFRVEDVLADLFFREIDYCRYDEGRPKIVEGDEREGENLENEKAEHQENQENEKAEKAEPSAYGEKPLSADGGTLEKHEADGETLEKHEADGVSDAVPKSNGSPDTPPVPDISADSVPSVYIAMEVPREAPIERPVVVNPTPGNPTQANPTPVNPAPGNPASVIPPLANASDMTDITSAPLRFSSVDSVSMRSVPTIATSAIDTASTYSTPTAAKNPDLAEPWTAEGAVFVRAHHHKHHLVTAKELEKLNQERERARKLKQSIG